MINPLRHLLAGTAKKEESPDKVQVATCALFLEMAHADGHLDAGEEQLLRSHLQRHFRLEADDQETLLECARQARKESVDLFLFAREINAACTLEEKLQIMETLWRIVYADGTLNKYEDALARELATLLRIDPRQAIDLKLKVLEETSST
jgi:uncharacterized tellurite resistance protein B-like protein